MMRALWTGASGMNAQQTNLDTISNNFANINTAGYKKEETQFSSLLYQKIQAKTTDAQGNIKPVAAQVGSGVRTNGTVSIFKQGTLQTTDNDLDFAIQGDGFFRVMDSKGQIAYTRNGSFQFAIGNGGVTLSTAEGYPVLDTQGNPIVLANTVSTSKVVIDEYGNLSYKNKDNQIISMDKQIGLAQFSNPSGLGKAGQSLYYETDASGQAKLEAEDESLQKSKVYSGYLEASNVDTANEIVNLIVAQRAYEMNSKAITAADEMLQQANNLRR